jgi:hypothetical protein
MGLLGNLSTAQIVEQLVEARRWLAEYTAQQQQQQQGIGDEGVQQQGSSGGQGRVKGVWPAQPPRINNIVFMVSSTQTVAAAAAAACMHAALRPVVIQQQQQKHKCARLADCQPCKQACGASMRLAEHLGLL